MSSNNEDRICPICKCTFKVESRYKGRKTCSRVCANKKLSQNKKGQKPKNFKYFQTFNQNRLGTKQSQSYKEHMRKVTKENGNMPPHYKGEKHWNWQGGKTELVDRIKTQKIYLLWRESVFKRDSYKCQWCGDKRGHNLEADHIVPKAILLEKHSIKTLEDAIRCKEFWNIDNGRTLCIECHKKTDTWGGKTRIRKLIGTKDF